MSGNGVDKTSVGKTVVDFFWLTEGIFTLESKIKFIYAVEIT